MADRFDVLVISKYKDKNTGEEKAQFNKVGVAFRTKEGGFTLKLFAIPTSGDLLFKEPRPRGNYGGGGNYRGRQQDPQDSNDEQPPF